MPTSLPEKKQSVGDKAWLFTKTTLFLCISLVMLMSGVASSVWAGGMAALSTGNWLIGSAVSISTYAAAMAGREWLHFRLSSLFFSKDDRKRMDDVVDGKE